MMKIRQSKSLIAMVAVLALFAGCKGDSPTAPPTTTGTPPGNPTTPPSSATITLTVSNPSPIASNSTVITATVTIGGQPAPNGTAVEFQSNVNTAIFADTLAPSTIRTTTNGTAQVTLTSPSPGTVTVTAFVGSASRSTQITFRTPETVPPNPDTSPAITGISPTSGLPAGGQELTITGRNLRGPFRVLFDFGGGVVKEATVLRSTSTSIVVLTPPIDLGAQQTSAATIRVITENGTATETLITAPGTFTYTSPVLTPNITTLLPTTGRQEGGQQVTIVGDGFQAPVQVFFGAGEAEVVRTTFNEILVISPPSRNTAPDGLGPVVGQVDVRVVNINSRTSDTLADGFRYAPALQITAVNPLEGPGIGGTNIVIDGTGFEDPVQVMLEHVSIAFDVRNTQVIRASGSQIIARTLPQPQPCGSGMVYRIVVTNVNTGATFETPAHQVFRFIPTPPEITNIIFPAPPVGGVPNSVQPGGTIQVTVLNPGTGVLGSGNVRFRIAGQEVVPTPSQVTDADGPVTFTVPIPAAVLSRLPQVICQTPSGPGTQFGTLIADLTFTNTSTTCSDTLEDSVPIAVDPAANPCIGGPATAEIVTPATGCAVAPAAPAASGTSTTTIVVRNSATAGSQSLVVTPSGITGTNAGDFSISPTTALTLQPGQSGTFTVTFDPSIVGAETANATFTTNAPNAASLSVCLQGNGT